MKLTRKTYTSRTEKIVDFVIGFVGWFILTALSGLISLVAITPSGAITSIYLAVRTDHRRRPVYCLPGLGRNLSSIIPLAALGDAMTFALALVVVSVTVIPARQILKGWE